jgi:predicted RNA-binding protein associated with RNAse of E/G family
VSNLTQCTDCEQLRLQVESLTSERDAVVRADNAYIARLKRIAGRDDLDNALAELSVTRKQLEEARARLHEVAHMTRRQSLPLTAQIHAFVNEGLASLSTREEEK